MAKENVISFRLDEKKFGSLTEKLKEQPVVGIKSTNQMARKIVNDFLAGRLAYANPADAKVDHAYLDVGS